MQEALNNVVRHAQASTATVGLTFADSVQVTVSDDGQGFAVPENSAEMAASRHFGLLGIHERAELIDATITINSQRKKGTTVTVQCNYI